MSNNASRADQWAEEPDRPQGPFCNHERPAWPHKLCNRAPGHGGDHCRRDFAGTQYTELWWPAEANLVVSSK